MNCSQVVGRRTSSRTLDCPAADVISYLMQGLSGSNRFFGPDQSPRTPDSCSDSRSPFSGYPVKVRVYSGCHQGDSAHHLLTKSVTS